MSIPIQRFSATLAEMRLNRTLMEGSINLSFCLCMVNRQQIKSSAYKRTNRAATVIWSSSVSDFQMVPPSVSRINLQKNV